MITKNERLTLGLQGKLYQLTYITSKFIPGLPFKAINEKTTKQRWSKEQIKRMMYLLSKSNVPHSFLITPYLSDI